MNRILPSRASLPKAALLGTALCLAACATTPVPNKRPVPEAQIEAMRDVPVVLVANEDGVQKSWFMKDSSASTAQFGLIGALTSSIMDAIINAGPARRAQRAADEVAEVWVADALDAALADQLTRTASGPALGPVTTVQKLRKDAATDEAIELRVTYLLAEDASAMRITALATYEDDEVPYVTPYADEGSVPKSERSGPLYRNSFVYHSAAFVPPTMNEALKDELALSVEDLFTGPDGVVPTEGHDDYKKMSKEVDKARDDKLSKSEIAFFLIREWTKDDGAALSAEIAKAHDFIATSLVADLADPTVPIMDGADRVIAELDDGRVVRIRGAGTQAGSYVSQRGAAASFVTYGNAAQAAEVNRDTAKQARKAVEVARKDS